ncbi:MAG: sigma-70 family RNA polymerase sigma factor [Chloroflexota bacterium]
MKVGRSQGSPGAPTPQDLEEAAVEAARRGDLRAWERLIRVHQELVFRSAYLATRDADLADETTRAAFIRAYRALPGLAPGAPLRPWLMSVAATMARTRMREMAQRQDAWLPDPHPSARYAATPVVIDPAIHRPTQLEHEALLSAFGGMIDEDRLLIVSRYILGLSRSEMAIRLGIPPEVVEDRLGTAVGRLRKRLAGPSATGVHGAHTPATPLHTAYLASIPDDQLGTIAAAVVVSGLAWTPDVAPFVCARLARDAVVYPEQFAHDSRASSVARARAAGAAGAASSSPGMSDGSQKAVRTAPRRPRQGLSMALATLVVFGVLVGIAVAAETPGLYTQAGVGGRIGSLLEQVGLGVAVQEVTESTPRQDPIGADPATIGADEASISVAGRPLLSVVGGRPFKGGGIGARVVVDWVPDAGLGPISNLRLQRRIGRGPWKFVASADAQESLGAVLHPGRRYSFRVHAYYEDGSVTKSPLVGATLTVRDSLSDRLRRPNGGWRTLAQDALGGSVLASTTSDASISTSFTGSKVALVVAMGPANGVIRARVDDGPWRRSDLGEPTRSARRVVLSRDLAKGRHSLDIQVDEGVVALDAVLIVRTYGVPLAG